MSTDTPTLPETETRSPYQSRWGWHPCTHETYMKLKALNKVYIRERNYFYALCRQLVKAPRNRTHAANCVSTAMSCSSAFITQYAETNRGGDMWGGNWWYKYLPGLTKKHPCAYYKRYPAKFDDLDIPTLYGAARYPVTLSVPARFAPHTVENIDRLYDDLCEGRES